METLLTIVAIWAVVIPLAVLAGTWKAANVRDERAASAVKGSVPHLLRAGGVPACAVPAARPRRNTTRRVCPERPTGGRARLASA